MASGSGRSIGNHIGTDVVHSTGLPRLVKEKPKRTPRALNGI
jgi:hypothetical protein